MGVNEIRSVIDRSAAELRTAGVSALYLFGSQARGEAGDASDIDLAFDVAPEANENFSLVDQAGLQIRLQELFGRKVDFFERSALLRRFGPRLDPLIKLL
jgi:predicted nucleotidyltransferase